MKKSSSTKAWAAAFLLATAGLAAGADVSNPSIGYTITLPQNWGLSQRKALQDYFRDSTRARRSQISIVRYDIDPADYPTPESWTQAQFIAYKLSVETSVFPFGAVMYFDSTAAAKIGPVWAPEAFSVLYPADGDPTYCEYIRYCAVGKFGYEIYAIGDSTDMVGNVDFYAGIIASLQFSEPASIYRAARNAVARRASPADYGFDALGRLRHRLRGAVDAGVLTWNPLRPAGS